MSYDLCFWRETSPHAVPPQVVSSQLTDLQESCGIALLPVAKIKERFLASFPEVEDSGNELNWEGAGSYFQVSWPIGLKPGFTAGIFVTCGYELLKTPDVVNRIIAVANEFGCALYDPQSDERNEQPEPSIV